MAYAVHELLDAIEHAVDVESEARKFVIARDQDAPIQITGLDLVGGAANPADAPLDLAAQEPGADDCQDERDCCNRLECVPDEVADRALLAKVTADIEPATSGQGACDQSRRW